MRLVEERPAQMVGAMLMAAAAALPVGRASAQSDAHQIDGGGCGAECARRASASAATSLRTAALLVDGAALPVRGARYDTTALARTSTLAGSPLRPIDGGRRRAQVDVHE